MGAPRREAGQCKVDGCERRHYGKGYCSMHYDRVKRIGSPHLPARPTECSADGCDLEPRTRGMCQKHYGQWYRKNAPRKCSVKGCRKPATQRGYCPMHYARWRRTGDPGPADLQKKFRDPLARTKECSTCNEVKEIGEFYRDPRYPDRSVARCKTCIARFGRGAALKSRYGITAGEFEEMLAEQGGRCATCDSTDGLCVDHDHKTGVVRQILCRQCNVALGQVDDDTETLHRLIEYVERHRAEN